MSWNARGTRLATADSAGAIKVWSLLEGTADINSQPLHTFNAHQGRVEQLSWHPTDARIFTTVGRDKTLRLWDVRQDKQAGMMMLPNEGWNAIWRPDGAQLAVRWMLDRKSDETAIIDPSSLSTVSSHKHTHVVNALDWCGNSHIVCTSGTGRVDVRDIGNDWKVVHSLRGIPEKLWSITANQRYIATGGAMSVAVWDVQDLVCVNTFYAGEEVRTLSIDASSTLVAASGPKGTLSVWDIESGDAVPTGASSDGTQAVHCVSWHPTRNILVFSIDKDNRIGYICCCGSGEEVVTPTAAAAAAAK